MQIKRQKCTLYDDIVYFWYYI